MNVADVLLCGAWDEGAGYPRTTSLRSGLLAAGYSVGECRVPGLGSEKQALLRAPWRWPAAVARGFGRRRLLLRELRDALREATPRCIVVPYPGHTVVGAVRAAAGSVPIVLDLFLSAYDTVVEDRRLVEPGSLIAAWLQRLDARACAAADLVLTDTPANAAYACALTGLPPDRFGWLPVSDPDAPLRPAPWTPPTGGRLRVLFFGTGVPLHGLPVLVSAVARVPAAELVLVGGTYADRAMARELLRDRLQLEPEFVDRARLQRCLDESHVVAGVFGGSGKTQRVVPFKVVHALASGRPVVTADTPAVAAWLDGSGACYTTPAGDVASLAAVLEDLAAAPERLAQAAAAARAAYERSFSTACLARRWSELLGRLRGPAIEDAA